MNVSKEKGKEGNSEKSKSKRQRERNSGSGGLGERTRQGEGVGGGCWGGRVKLEGDVRSASLWWLAAWRLSMWGDGRQTHMWLPVAGGVMTGFFQHIVTGALHVLLPALMKTLYENQPGAALGQINETTCVNGKLPHSLDIHLLGHCIVRNLLH